MKTFNKNIAFVLIFITVVFTILGFAVSACIRESSLYAMEITVPETGDGVYAEFSAEYIDPEKPLKIHWNTSNGGFDKYNIKVENL